MKYNELITAIAGKTKQPERVIKQTLNAFLETLKNELKKENNTIFLSQFGKFKTRFAKAKNFNNLPIEYNGVSNLVYKRIHFHPYQSTKRAINSEE